MKNVFIKVLFVVLAVMFAGSAANAGTRNVLATAYTSHSGQTDSTPNVAAWGDRLHPGMRAIAVSRDLEPLGYTHGAKVDIAGLQGTYIVRDRMNARWRSKIDVYYGLDKRGAKRWGKRHITITLLEPGKANKKKNKRKLKR